MAVAVAVLMDVLKRLPNPLTEVPVEVLVMAAAEMAHPSAIPAELSLLPNCQHLVHQILVAAVAAESTLLYREEVALLS